MLLFLFTNHYSSNVTPESTGHDDNRKRMNFLQRNYKLVQGTLPNIYFSLCVCASETNFLSSHHVAVRQMN